MHLIANSIVKMLHQAYLATFVHPVVYIVMPALIIGTIVAGDAVVPSWRPADIPRTYWSLLDPPVHVLLALLVSSPLFFHHYLRRHAIRWVLVAGLATVLLDLDHLIVARSLSLHDITHLHRRPVTHSLLFAVGCGTLVYPITRRGVIGWLIFTVLASHVLRDASSGSTPFLWPISSPYTLPTPLYYVAELGLYAVSITVASAGILATASRRDRDAVDSGQPETPSNVNSKTHKVHHD